MIEFKFEKTRNTASELLRLYKMPQKAMNEVEKELIYTVQFIRSTIIKNSRNTPKTGRRYRKTKNKSVFHFASSPGYPPAVDTGEFIRSIVTDVRRKKELEVEVGSNMKDEYPIYLEHGTAEMEARPWLEPAVMDGERYFYINVNHAVKRAIMK